MKNLHFVDVQKMKSYYIKTAEHGELEVKMSVLNVTIVSGA